MLVSRGLRQIPRTSFQGVSRWFVSHRPVFSQTSGPQCPRASPAPKVYGGFEETGYWRLPALYGFRCQVHHQSSSVVEDQLDPFSLVADELSLVANRLREMVVAEVPKLASAAEYFFKMGVEGKRFRPTVKAIVNCGFCTFVINDESCSKYMFIGIERRLLYDLVSNICFVPRKKYCFIYD